MSRHGRTGSAGLVGKEMSHSSIQPYTPEMGENFAFPKKMGFSVFRRDLDLASGVEINTTWFNIFF